MFYNIKVIMNKNIFFILIPLVVVLVFILCKKKTENFKKGVTFTTTGNETVQFNKCKTLRNILYDPKGGTFHDNLINPTAADNPLPI